MSTKRTLPGFFKGRTPFIRNVTLMFYDDEQTTPATPVEETSTGAEQPATEEAAS